MWAGRASTWPQSHPLEHDTSQRSSQDILHCQGKTHSWRKCLVLRLTQIVVNKLLQKERCLNISREYQPKSSCGCDRFNFVLGINLIFLCSKLNIRDVRKYNQNNNVLCCAYWHENNVFLRVDGGSISHDIQEMWKKEIRQFSN